jgi:hypothetical protein
VFVATAVVLILVARPGEPQQCGIKRWAVKTMADSEARSVDLDPTSTTVEGLVAEKPPDYDRDGRRTSFERKTYAIVADVVFVKKEADQDVHVVVRGESGATMIVEFPADACVGDSVVRSRMAAARTALLALLPTWPAHRSVLRLRQPVRVKITGVAFLDDLHHQRGAAPNGVELHPILSIEKVEMTPPR